MIFKYVLYNYKIVFGYLFLSYKLFGLNNVNNIIITNDM